MALQLQRMLLLLAFMLTVVTAVWAQQCGENTEFNSCGTACPAKCSDPPNLGRACTANCVAGCFCKSGYLRNNAGNCVLRENC